jgi:spore coat polysaccharide biosynthesis predicted glycosyltransferase SpsG
MIEAGRASEATPGLRIVLLPDCGVGVGLGHLERALALADALRGSGATPLVAVSANDSASADRVAARGHTVLLLEGRPVDEAETAVRKVSPAVAVLDGYTFGVTVHARLRRRCLLVAIDDLGADSDCDLAVNPSALRDAPMPRGAAAFLGGPRYALIGSAYRAARARREASQPAERSVLVAAGATSLGHFAVGVARDLLQRDASVLVTLVLGPDTANVDVRPHPRLHVVRGAPDLAELMESAAVYAGAAGVSALQAACVGIPAAVFPLVDNQRAQAKALHGAGCAVVAARPTSDALADVALALLDDSPRRVRMSDLGRALVDGFGAERVAAAILALPVQACPDQTAVGTA